MFNPYLKAITKTHNQGDAREETYYSALEDLLKEFANETKRKKTVITVLPKSTEAGNPDFRVWDGNQKIVGYIEAKVPGADLYNIEDSEQLERYRNTFPNLILTDFLSFRLYKNGDLVNEVMLGRKNTLLKLGKAPVAENTEEMTNLLEQFFQFSLSEIKNARQLATELAKRTRFLKDEVIELELEQKNDALTGIYEAFKEFLIADLPVEEFADYYAQTITYGLFAARIRTDGEFKRKNALEKIPKTNGILREVFKFISDEDNLPPSMEWAIDDIAEVLAVTDARSILDEYYKQGKGNDPVLHFYETFLDVYDPDTRDKRGVYYTPEPVVSYIVRSLHEILKTEFKLAHGLADEKVTLLDPAGGTLSFLAHAINHAVAEYVEAFGEGGKERFIKERILKNYHAFELMMAPYAIGHLKISYMLQEHGYDLEDNDRIKFYLTNTLDMTELADSKFPGFSSLSKESHEAGEIKKKTPILCILGNPPYYGHSVNKGEWILEKLKDYYKIDGVGLGEKNTKWLQDDYVKFIRFAQSKIDDAGEGIVGFITNHGYLDSPTFRGMRHSLMQSFDRIHILDLHGNQRINEKTPSGGKDENVFDIRPGTAIVFLVKKTQAKKKLIRTFDLFGQREAKYDWLVNHSVKTTPWNQIEPKPDSYLFKALSNKHYNIYRKFTFIPDIFHEGSNGLYTAKDILTIGYNSGQLLDRIRLFSELDNELARDTFKLGLDTKNWNIESAKADIKTSGQITAKIRKILYRPFDIRYTYYTGKTGGFMSRPRTIMKNFIELDNIAICVGRQGESTGSKEYNAVFITNKITDLNLFKRGGELIFPLNMIDDSEKNLFDDPNETPVKNNIKSEIIEQLKNQLGEKFSTVFVLYFVYSVMHSDIYREKYAEFIKKDFPRIPFTSDKDLFLGLSGLGERLAKLHLLESDELARPIARFEGTGSSKVEKIDYRDNRVYINPSQYFEGVPEEVYEYQVGGYTVCNKWLKDRKGRELSTSEIETYCKIVTALAKTIEIQSEIDTLYPRVEENLLEIKL